MIYVPSRMGQLNRRALIRQLQKFGVASRADLAKALGMSQPTAGKIVDELIAMEVIEEAIMTALPADKVEARGLGDPVGPLGRPGRKLRLNQSRVQFLAIHLGVNTTMLAGLTLGASGEDRWPVAFEIGGADASPAKAWEKKLRQAANSLGDDEYLGVLLSAPGVVDEEENRVLFSPNMHWTEKNDIAAIIGRIWDVPVLLVQEERALALGHHLADPDFEDFLLVDFGEGVGGAIIVEGNPFASPLPISGEIGHTPVPGNVRPCGCGAVGCVETLISVRGLLESFSAAAPTVDHSWSGLGDYISQNGIKPWLARALDLAAAAIAGALNVLGLRRVVVTGSLTELPPVVMEHLAHAVRNGAMWARFGKVECVSAPRRRTAGMVAMGIDRLVLPEVKRESPTAGLRPLAEYTWSGAKSVSVPPNPTHKKKKT
jgi:predicted NBD/HSP70 family sugar kinase